MAKVDHIPGDLAADILFRLPSKSLLRFKSVCKTWYASISDSEFINLHTERASENPKIIFSTGSHLQILDYQSSSSSSSRLSDPIPFPDESCPFHPMKILGSSRGLVCIASTSPTAPDDYKNRIFIWNPFSGKVKKIGFWWPPDVIFTDYLHGFCYDPVANDFMLVVSKHCGVFMYFSFKHHQCWTLTITGVTIDPHTTPVRWTNRPVTTLSTELNGVLHWIVTPDHIYGYCSEVRILSFDLATRKVHKPRLDVPPFVSSSSQDIGIVGLFEHRGCLCLYFSPNTTSKEIWIMEKYGDNNSWVRLLAVPNSESLPTGFDFCYAHILSITPRDEVLLHDKGTFIRFRSKEGKFDEEAICIQPNFMNSAALCALDTLVSPYDIKKVYSPWDMVDEPE